MSASKRYQRLCSPFVVQNIRHTKIYKDILAIPFAVHYVRGLDVAMSNIQDVHFKQTLLYVRLDCILIVRAAILHLKLQTVLKYNEVEPFCSYDMRAYFQSGHQVADEILLDKMSQINFCFLTEF